MPYRIRIGACLIVAGWSALAPDAAAAPRNIVLFVTDDESPTLGCYGDPVAVTPAVDALAADGTRLHARLRHHRQLLGQPLGDPLRPAQPCQRPVRPSARLPQVCQLVRRREPRRCRGPWPAPATAPRGSASITWPPRRSITSSESCRGNGRNAVQMAEACQRLHQAARDERPFFLYFATSDPHRGGGIDETSPLELKPDLFGNKPEPGQPIRALQEVFFDPAEVPVPAFLPDTPETRSELAQYYQSCAGSIRASPGSSTMLKEAGLYDKTLIVFTSDHGMAFPGGKTTVYEPGLRVPLRRPRSLQAATRACGTDALSATSTSRRRSSTSPAASTATSNRPNTLDRAGGVLEDKPYAAAENRGPRNGLERLPRPVVAADPRRARRRALRRASCSSHTFHEIQMYYPMRVGARPRLQADLEHRPPPPLPVCLRPLGRQQLAGAVPPVTRRPYGRSDRRRLHPAAPVRALPHRGTIPTRPRISRATLPTPTRSPPTSSGSGTAEGPRGSLGEQVGI